MSRFALDCRRPVAPILTALMLLAAVSSALAADANRLAYLDDPCDPYVFGLDSPRLTTPQWVGEPGVEAVITLGIDDMRDADLYETFLRPILERLKKIDGRAPVSILTNQIDPKHPRLQEWLREGLSIETHTADHPCPCLESKGFETAKSTYDRCVDQMSAILGSRPVAFRFPCCDSMNSPSPRAFAEILSKTTAAGNYLQIDTSVCVLLDENDPLLPRSMTRDAQGRQRFAKYAPFRNFVNRVFNYPYPYVVNNAIWEFPIGVPDDWQGFHVQQSANPATLEDTKLYVDAVLLKQGVANLVFHPHGWVRADQMIALIDHVVETHKAKCKFLTFKECIGRVNANLLAGQPVRAADGGDNGVRLLDLNNDGFMDVVIGNDELQRTRLWNPRDGRWIDGPLPFKIVQGSKNGRLQNHVKFGVVDESGLPIALVRGGQASNAWRFVGASWQSDDRLLQGLEIDKQPVLSVKDGLDRGVRLRDIDGDGRCELLVANPDQRAVFQWNAKDQAWRRLPFDLPEGVWFADAAGRDGGTRLVDVDADGAFDLLDACERGSNLFLFDSMKTGWTRQALVAPPGAAKALPQFVRGGTNGGVWIAGREIWLQNEETHRLPDLVFHRSFNELLGDTPDHSLGPAAGLKSMHVVPGYRVELAAAEPLVMDPVAFDWGPDGKLWVVEMADYPLGIDGKGKPGGRVRYLEDTDNDGKYDKTTLFLDGIGFPNGVLAWRDGVLVTAAPEVFFARDTDGDGRCDERTTLYEGFAPGNQQHRVNGLRWSIDGWVHLANGDSGGQIRSIKTGDRIDISARDLRLRPDAGSLETTTGMTQFGRTRDDFSHWFGINNAAPGYQFVLDDHYLRRNRHVAPPAPFVQVVDPGPLLHPLSRTAARFNHPGGVNHFTSACSGMIYRDDLLEDLAGSYFLCEPVHNMVHREVLAREGLLYRGSRPATEQNTEFLRSTDNWSRPVMIRTGPDGALWIADMYREIIEHPQWIPDDVEAKLDLRAGHDKGRIYRVAPVDKPVRPMVSLDKLAAAGLAAALDSPNGTQRDRVQQMLLWRADKAAVAPLRRLAENAALPAVRAQALWTLALLEASDDELVLKALADANPQVRAEAIKIAEPRLNGSSKLGAGVIALAGDADPDVQLQLAYTLGEWRDPRASVALGEMAVKHAGDAYFTAAVLSSVNPSNIAEVLARVLSAQPPAARLVEQLLAMAAAEGNQEALAKAIEFVTAPVDGSFADWQHAALASALAELRRGGKPFADTLGSKTMLRITAMLAGARKLAGDGDAPPARRVAAIRLLGESLQGDGDFETLAGLINPRQPFELQSAAIDALAKSSSQKTVEKLTAGWDTYTPALRSQVLDTLLSREGWSLALLERIEKGTVSAIQIDASRRQRLLESKSKVVQTRAQKLLALDSGTRAQVVRKHQSVLKLSGDATRGRAVFVKRCSACHVLEGQGHAVGADLAAVGNKSPEALLVAMLDPNRAIEDRYVTYVAQLDDGRQFSGVLAAESGESLTLLAQEGKKEVILRKQIEVLRGTGKSLMPEGLEKDLSPQELADVIAYVGGFSPPKKFTGNEPRVVRPEADGSLKLPASAARIHGSTLIFEPKYQNLGYWGSENDVASWDFELPAAGRYELTLDYACDNGTAGNSFELESAGRSVRGKVAGTGSWDEYRQIHIGRLDLPAGVHTLSFRAAPPLKQSLIDLRTIQLKPAK